ncbi:MAG: aspartate aminotransferase family protein, partial [Alphaproteobacteria bacterium]
RTIGLVGAIELETGEAPGKRAFDVCCEAFHNQDVMVRVAGDILVFSPPFIITENQMAEGMERVHKTLQAI